MALALIHGNNGSCRTVDGMADTIKAVPQFDGSGNPIVVLKNTFLDFADANAAQPKAPRSFTAPPCFDATCTAPKLVSRECDSDSTICGESSGDESDSAIGESCGDTDFCQESIEPHFTWETTETVENSAFHEVSDDREWGVGSDSGFEMATADEFDEPPAIESDMESSRSLSVIDLASPTRDLMSLPPTQSASDAEMVTDSESEAKERAVWADLDYEESPAPAPTFLSPTPPPSHGELDKGLEMMPFNSDSNVCTVRWKLQAKYFNSTNTTKTSPEFAVSFNSGKSLRFRIGLHPGEDGNNFGSWKKWKGQGRASLKITDELEEQTSIRFQFVFGHQRDSENHAVLHDFSNNSLKHTDSVNFSSAAEGPDVFIYVEFLPSALPVLQ